MADMKIAMTLTMADLASPEIQKFKSNLAQLEKYLAGLNDSFKLNVAGASDLGKALAGAVAGITRASKATADMGSSASRSSGSLAGLTKTLAQAEAETAALFQSSMVMNKEALKSAFTYEKAAAAATEYDASMTPLAATLARVQEETQAAIASTLEMNKAQLKSIFTYEKATEAATEYNASVTPLGATLARVQEETQAAIVSTLEMNRAQLKSIFTYEKAEVAATEYDASVTRIGDTLRAVAAQTQEMIAATMTMDKTMLSAAFAATGLGDKSLAAAGKLGAVGDAAKASSADIGTLTGQMHGLKGIMEAVAAVGGYEAIKDAVVKAASFQQTKLQISARNLPTGEYGNLVSQAKTLSGKYPYSMGQILKAELSALPMMPGQSAHSQMIRAAIMPKVLSTAFEMQRFGSKMSLPELSKELFGLVDMSGGSKNLGRADMVLDVAGRAAGASGGKITPQTLHTSFRYLNAGISGSMNKSSMMQFMALVDQFKGTGEGGASRAATVYNNIFAAATKGIIGKGLAVLLEKVGLLNPKDVHAYGHSSTRVMLTPGALLGSSMAATNPGEWLATYGTERLLAYTQAHWKEFGYKGNTKADFTNPQQIAHAMAQIQSYAASFGMGAQAYANAAAIYGNPSRVRGMKEQVVQMQQFESSTEYMQQALKTLNGSWKSLTAQLSTTATLLGGPMITNLTNFNNGLAGLLAQFNKMLIKFPALTDVIDALLVVITGLTAVKAVEWLLGVRASFKALLGIGGVVKTVDGVAAGSEKMGGALSKVSSSVSGMLPLLLRFAGAISLLKLATNISPTAKIPGQVLGAKNQSLDNTATSIASGIMSHVTGQPIEQLLNNPGGIRKWGNLPLVKAGNNGYFVKFASALAGLHAMSENLQAYGRQGMDTLNTIIPTWNGHGANSGAYIADVHKWTGFKPGQALNLSSAKIRASLMAAIVRQELGKTPYSAALIAQAAGVGDRPDSEQRTANAMYNAAQKIHIQPGSLLAGMQTPTDVKVVNAGKAELDAQNKLSEAFRKRIEDALRFQAHLQNIANGIHAAYQGIFDPLSSKIPAIQAKYRSLSGYLLTNGHTKAAQEALAVGHHQVLGLQYKGAMGHLAGLQRNLHLGTTDNAALLKTGVITNAQATDRNIKLQQQMAPQMQKAAEAALKYAEALKDPALVAALKEQLANIGTMGKQLGYYGTKFKQSLQSSFNGLFNNLMNGQKTLGESFAAFFASIGKSLENQLSKSLSQSITDAITGKHGSSGLGSLFSGITGMFSNVFGSGSSSSSSNPFAGAAIMGSGSSSGGSSTMSSIGGIIKGITSIAGLFGFASGADNIPNDMVANIHKGEMIIPAAGASLIRSGQAGIGGGGGPTLHMHINTIDSQDFLGHLHEIRAQATQMFLDTAQHLNVQGVG
ncbi:hypothetical protein [Acidithiobacillus thiooxidans]|uniref:hypothetical protein n=1 Tax=Acidithiobacillus thiooxidans TaxID=930 RepID=UPI0009DB39E4|nr:hypothetical protein [Acidithiobacillus thiooxidans]